MTRKRPTTDLAVLRSSAAVNFTHPDRIANSMSREPLKLARITFGNVQRKGSQDFLRYPSRTSFADSPAKGELPATATNLPQAKRGSL